MYGVEYCNFMQPSLTRLRWVLRDGTLTSWMRDLFSCCRMHSQTAGTGPRRGRAQGACRGPAKIWAVSLSTPTTGPGFVGRGGECNWPDPHRAFVPGRGPVTVQHICAKCYLTEKKKLPHPESSESCPCPAAGTTWQIPQQSQSAHSGFTSEPVTFDTVALVSSGKDFIKYMVLVDKAVHDSRKPNFIGCQIPVPSGLNFDYLEKELADYKDCHILLLLRYGCPINYEGPGCLSRVCHYHRVPHISRTT